MSLVTPQAEMPALATEGLQGVGSSVVRRDYGKEPFRCLKTCARNGGSFGLPFTLGEGDGT
jgi:hypothetical protein